MFPALLFTLKMKVLDSLMLPVGVEHPVEKRARPSSHTFYKLLLL